MIFFRYQRYLEKQVEELKAEKAQLQARVDKLTEALVPVLRRMGQEQQVTAGEVVKKKSEHKITKTERTAQCTCGWVEMSDDPGELQQQISKHYREQVIRPGRKSWPQIKQLVESQPEKEIA